MANLDQNPRFTRREKVVVHYGCGCEDYFERPLRSMPPDSEFVHAGSNYRLHSEDECSGPRSPAEIVRVCVSVNEVHHRGSRRAAG